MYPQNWETLDKLKKFSKTVHNYCKSMLEILLRIPLSHLCPIFCTPNTIMKNASTKDPPPETLFSQI